jgi:hypothetical protein
MRNESIQDDGIARSAKTSSPDRLVTEIIDLAKVGLPRMFDSERQLFCEALRREEGGQLVQRGISHRYTMMALLGLHRLETSGSASPVSIAQVMDALTRDLGWIKFGGDLGLLLWLCAVVDPGRLDSLGAKLDLKNVLVRYKDARQRSTTELAWILAGLSHAKLAGVSAIPELNSLSATVYGLLKANQGPHGIFGHLVTTSFLSGRLRGRIGSFADQVYPIYTLTQFGQAYGDSEAIRCARDCAEAIVRLQGPLGQWWWHYDASTGQVLQRYPVFSVHQDGMAPMALFALGEATRTDFREPIYKGLAWISGNNELVHDLRDKSLGVIWRSLYRSANWKKYRDEFREFMRPGWTAKSGADLKILFECRPYHFGWLLYAFAGRAKRMHET